MSVHYLSIGIVCAIYLFCSREIVYIALTMFVLNLFHLRAWICNIKLILVRKNGAKRVEEHAHAATVRLMFDAPILLPTNRVTSSWWLRCVTKPQYQTRNNGTVSSFVNISDWNEDKGISRKWINSTNQSILFKFFWNSDIHPILLIRTEFLFKPHRHPLEWKSNRMVFGHCSAQVHRKQTNNDNNDNIKFVVTHFYDMLFRSSFAVKNKYLSFHYLPRRRMYKTISNHTHCVVFVE